MRPLTIILLIVLLGGISFFGFTIYQKKQQAQNAVDSSTKTAPVSYSFKLKVGSNSVLVNNEPVTLDVPVKEIDGRVLVPLSFFKDYLGAQNVNYDGKTEEVTFDLEIPLDQLPKKETSGKQDTLDSLLTQENKDKILSTASMSTTFFKIHKIESDGNAVSIWIDLISAPGNIADVQKITDTFANDVSFIFETKHDIRVVAIRTEQGKEQFKTFGTSRFKSSSGKIEFTEEKK